MKDLNLQGVARWVLKGRGKADRDFELGCPEKEGGVFVGKSKTPRRQVVGQRAEEAFK